MTALDRLQSSDKAKNSERHNIYEGKYRNFEHQSRTDRWRRSKVTELRARGLSHAEIASELQVSRTSIASDVHYLRDQAKRTIKEYATDHLPLAFDSDKYDQPETTGRQTVL